MQVYLHAEHTKVVRPVKELVAYKRVHVPKGEQVPVTIPVPASVTCYYDADMVFGDHGGDFTLLVGTSAEDVPIELRIR